MNMTLLFVLTVLAVWRDSLMVAEEEGPFGLLNYVRDHVDPQQRTWVGRGLNCQWCVSVWSALAFTIWLWYFGWVEASLIPIWWFGLSGGSVVLSIVHSWTITRRR